MSSASSLLATPADWSQAEGQQVEEEEDVSLRCWHDAEDDTS